MFQLSIFALMCIFMMLSIELNGGVAGSSIGSVGGAGGTVGLVGYGQTHQAIRRMDCSVFCRRTGFNGYVGGCQCGFTLFASKRAQQTGMYGQPLLLAARILVPASAGVNAPDMVVEETQEVSSSSSNHHRDDASDV